MTDRKGTSEKTTPSSSDLATQRPTAKLKRSEKRGGYDALTDEEPQICRGID